MNINYHTIYYTSWFLENATRVYVLFFLDRPSCWMHACVVCRCFLRGLMLYSLSSPPVRHAFNSYSQTRLRGKDLPGSRQIFPNLSIISTHPNKMTRIFTLIVSLKVSRLTRISTGRIPTLSGFDCILLLPVICQVILLTTHFMDEADILADRKAIMSQVEKRKKKPLKKQSLSSTFNFYSRHFFYQNCRDPSAAMAPLSS